LPCENGAVNPWLIGAPVATAAAIAGAVAYGGVHPRAQFFGSTICRTDSPRKLAITFDDGPNPAVTRRLLDLLDRYKAPATFFLIGRYIRESPELVIEISTRGHAIGNHTESHPSLFWKQAAQIRVELRLTYSALRNLLGAPPKWFRPPFGLRNPWLAAEARELNMRVVMWTLLPGDWKAPSSEWLIQRMKPIAERAQRALQRPSGTGQIICLHDGSHREQNADRTHTLTALEYWLPRWRDLGLEFVTIGNAVGAPAT
jgi:peptidoglycan/xylan/chitin deacetylase (PgdA/CDA1 family)